MGQRLPGCEARAIPGKQQLSEQIDECALRRLEYKLQLASLASGNLKVELYTPVRHDNYCFPDRLQRVVTVLMNADDATPLGLGT